MRGTAETAPQTTAAMTTVRPRGREFTRSSSTHPCGVPTRSTRPRGTGEDGAGERLNVRRHEPRCATPLPPARHEEEAPLRLEAEFRPGRARARTSLTTRQQEEQAVRADGTHTRRRGGKVPRGIRNALAAGAVVDGVVRRRPGGSSRPVIGADPRLPARLSHSARAVRLPGHPSRPSRTVRIRPKATMKNAMTLFLRRRPRRRRPVRGWHRHRWTALAVVTRRKSTPRSPTSTTPA